MIKFYLIFFTVLLFSCGALAQDPYAYSTVFSKVFFQIHPLNGQPFNLTSNITAAKQKCPDTAPLSWIIHGWLEGFYTTEWVPLVLNNTLKTVGGCVIFMDYSFYSKQGYGEIVIRYNTLRDILYNTLLLFGNYDRMNLFGFSFGSRLGLGAGNNLTNLFNGTIVFPEMQLCDCAGPEFDYYNIKRVPAQRAAKNVACINTSDGYGTNIYDCHQNFKMGHCGRWQDASGPYPKGSHGLCPYFYNLAFTYNFTHNPVFQGDCIYPFSQVNRPLNATCQKNMIMGLRNKMFCIGDVIIPTAMCAPYLYNNTIYNYPTGKYAC